MGTASLINQAHGCHSIDQPKQWPVNILVPGGYDSSRLGFRVRSCLAESATATNSKVASEGLSPRGRKNYNLLKLHQVFSTFPRGLRFERVRESPSPLETTGLKLKSKLCYSLAMLVHRKPQTEHRGS